MSVAPQSMRTGTQSVPQGQYAYFTSPSHLEFPTIDILSISTPLNSAKSGVD